MSDYLDPDLTAAAGAVGVWKISVVVQENALSMMSFIFQEIEDKHAETVPEIRFFNGSQFHESTESVAWFD